MPKRTEQTPTALRQRNTRFLSGTSTGAGGLLMAYRDLPRWRSSAFLRWALWQHLKEMIAIFSREHRSISGIGLPRKLLRAATAGGLPTRLSGWGNISSNNVLGDHVVMGWTNSRYRLEAKTGGDAERKHWLPGKSNELTKELEEYLLTFGYPQRHTTG